ncbi:hypothetical protein WP50_14040, partial [Lactiplantibacillus plantarum]
LSIIMMMSKKLMTLGFFPWFSKTLGHLLNGMNWISVLIILFLAYFYLHYMFPSVSTQISALYAGFLSIAIGAGVPHVLEMQGITVTWMQWFMAACVPGILSLLIIPWVLYKVYPPEVKQTPDAHRWATTRLAALGKMTASEKIMSITFILAIVLWLIGTKIGIDATEVSFIAVVILLITGVFRTSDDRHSL